MGSQFLDGRFRLGVGIEDTFVPQEGLGRRALDEYALTQHYDRWSDDLALAAEAGATSIRYGLPWHLVNPEPGRFVWDWADRVVDRMSELGLEVIFDLVHYGTPLWLDNQFVNRSYPDRIADYAAALATRYGDRITAWTPLNEPQWTARRSGEMGVWPPELTGHDGYLQVMLAIGRGICRSQQAIVEASPVEPSFVHVEASFRYPRLEGEQSIERDLLDERRFLALDLVTGRVDDAHPLAAYLASRGVTDADLAWFAENRVSPDVIGVNYYPMWSTFEYRGESGTERDDGVAGLDDVLRTYAARYDRPVMVTETSYEGTMPERAAWLADSLDTIRRLRSEIDVVGYIWWPFFDQIKWQYREGTAPVIDFLHPLGLVDLVPDEIGVLHRRPNALFGDFQSFALAERGRQ
ncbi:MAG: family 1 glycosylhydrolase [Protaetiibacter sp.]